MSRPVITAPSGSLDRDALLGRAAAIVGASRVLTEPSDTEGYQRDWRGRYKGEALAVFLPANTAEVAALVRLCRELGVAIVPQAGNTGLVAGSIARGDRPCVLLNVSRLNRIREVDARNNSMVAEAGCILANVRAAAEEHDRLFPMLLGSVGSCEIGGLVSTNAGGTGVLRYGNMRELVMGLEVVLPDGTVWEGLKALRKDNSGYDLKQLFIGAEGTLGIVTAAVLKLFPRPIVSATAMVALEGVAQAVDLLRFMQARIGQRIEAFEILSREQVEIAVAHGPGLSSPMPLERPFYILLEVADSVPQWDAAAEIERALASALEEGLIVDAVVATDLAKARAIWDLRHNISEANRRAGFTISNDTSVPVSKLPEFIDRVTRRITQGVASARVLHAGHIGDGNIHVIAILPREIYATNEQCEKGAAAVNLIVHEESVALGGSISAEHGVGGMHVERLERFKPAIDLAMMRAVKSAFDPLNLMNPGKILRA
ncbi:MAG: FAD-binding oxidoreductase [Betaproteobacteria bacterium]